MFYKRPLLTFLRKREINFQFILSRLDQILGKAGSKKPDVYESKICLAARVVKVERQVEDIETKLDLLLDMYKEDRKRPTSQGVQLQSEAEQAEQAAQSDSKHSQLRSILVDKQQSEPPTPTTLVGKPIQRNWSDLSSRSKKKKVTYRCASATDVKTATDLPPPILKKRPSSESDRPTEDKTPSNPDIQIYKPAPTPLIKEFSQEQTDIIHSSVDSETETHDSATSALSSGDSLAHQYSSMRREDSDDEIWNDKKSEAIASCNSTEMEMMSDDAEDSCLLSPTEEPSKELPKKLNQY